MAIEKKHSQDVLLTQAAAEGHLEARRKLAERLYCRIRSTLSYVTKNADAEDLTQVALIQILRTAETYRGENSIEAWADRIAVRCALKFFDKNRRRRNITEATWFPTSTVDTTEELVDKRQARYRLASLLRQLPEEQALTLVLHYQGGYKVEEIAAMMTIPVNTVRGRICTGRTKMRQLILADPILGDWMKGKWI